jgi:hypothetical protein
MRKRQAKLWRKARQALRDLPTGPRAAIKRYWKICGCPGDPVYLLTIIQEKGNDYVQETTYPGPIKRITYCVVPITLCTHQARAPLGIADRRVRPRS